MTTAAAASSCDLYTDGIAGGLAGALRGVDCVAGEMAQAAFARLFGPSGELAPALTIFFTLFVALFGIVLMTGRTRVGISQLTPRLATLVLVALGPIFVSLVPFDGTRGLFVGWLKGLTMLALAPLFAVLAGGVMLELAVPVISSLATQQGNVDPRAAMAFFLIGAVHVALMMLVLKVSATMVAGWTVFGIARDRSESRTIVTNTTAGPALQPLEAAAALAATPAADGALAKPSRTHGIGSRFRAPSAAKKPEMIR